MSNGAQPSSREIGVLICDDTEAMRTLLRVVIDLRPALRVVGEATDGLEAIREATRLQPQVILLDLAMPIRTGLDALPEIRAAVPDAQIIVLSGFRNGKCRPPGARARSRPLPGERRRSGDDQGRDRAGPSRDWRRRGQRPARGSRRIREVGPARPARAGLGSRSHAGLSRVSEPR